jgi:hypothetical protein
MTEELGGNPSVINETNLRETKTADVNSNRQKAQSGWTDTDTDRAALPESDVSKIITLQTNCNNILIKTKITFEGSSQIKLY